MIQSLALISIFLAIAVKGDNSCYPNCAAAETIVGPQTGQESQWHTQWQSWKQTTLANVKYNSSVYDNNRSLFWSQTSYMQPQMMAHDRYFWDNAVQGYTVSKYLNDVGTRFGGIDSVLIWPTYPNIGIDDRNQFQMIADMPDGIGAAVAAFQAAGVRCLLPYNPWDSGTQPNAGGKSDAEMLADAVAQISADGINGDTLEVVPVEFWDDASPKYAIQPEEGGNSTSLWYTKMGWGYWTPYPYIPSVDRWKYLEHRHLTNVCERWATDRQMGLQAAFFNGCGYEPWENIWGTWNSISERDSAAIRRVAAILRFAGGVLSGGFEQDAVKWTPYDTFFDQTKTGVFASRFDTPYVPEWGTLGYGGVLTPALSSTPITMWTVINRNANLVNATCSFKAAHKSARCFDLYRGIEVLLDTQRTGWLAVEGLGYSAVMCLDATRAQFDSVFLTYLGLMKAMTQTPLTSLSMQTPLLQQSMTRHKGAQGPGGPHMTAIPAGSFLFYSRGREVEGQHRPGIDFQYPWEHKPSLRHSKQMQMKAFYIDTFPVTNAQYHNFLQRTGYAPANTRNFLRDWTNGAFPSGWDNKPVTWVSQADAKAYCASVGARLPNEWEWQYAAQSTDNRNYPWGSQPDATCVPTPFTGRVLPGPADVDAMPTRCASPFGVRDLVGNVWQWTNEFADEHTRAASLKGGCYYQPSGSRWYFPNLQKVYEHGKFLLMGEALNRAGTLGFRCVQEK